MGFLTNLFKSRSREPSPARSSAGSTPNRSPQQRQALPQSSDATQVVSRNGPSSQKMNVQLQAHQAMVELSKSLETERQQLLKAMANNEQLSNQIDDEIAKVRKCREEVEKNGRYYAGLEETARELQRSKSLLTTELERCQESVQQCQNEKKALQIQSQKLEQARHDVQMELNETDIALKKCKAAQVNVDVRDKRHLMQQVNDLSTQLTDKNRENKRLIEQLDECELLRTQKDEFKSKVDELTQLLRTQAGSDARWQEQLSMIERQAKQILRFKDQSQHYAQSLTTSSAQIQQLQAQLTTFNDMKREIDRQGGWAALLEKLKTSIPRKECEETFNTIVKRLETNLAPKLFSARPGNEMQGLINRFIQESMADLLSNLLRTPWGYSPTFN